MEGKNYCSFSQCVLVSSPDQIFRTHPAALLKNRVSTPLLLKQGRNYTSVSSCCWTNQIAQGSKLCLTSSQIASLQIFWHQLKLKLLHTAALNTDPRLLPSVSEATPHENHLFVLFAVVVSFPGAPSFLLLAVWKMKVTESWVHTPSNRNWAGPGNKAAVLVCSMYRIAGNFQWCKFSHK